jgi:CheY-like chemotaxis protein
MIRLRIVSSQPAPGGMWPMEHAVLAPLAPPSPDVSEHPVVLMGHGLKRAYLVADRLIWRMTADPCENEWGTPGSGLRETVRTEDGEIFWVADPGRLLADVELPEIAIEPPGPPAEAVVLAESDVQPLGMAPESGSAPAARAPEPAPVALALVADDSLTTRLLLARLLEQQGFTVEAVPDATSLIARLEQSAWTVAFTDIELPDGSGPEWLRGVRDFAASRPHPVPLVALVRDGGDLDVARAAGVPDVLLKPFARESLAALIARHGWGRS